MNNTITLRRKVGSVLLFGLLSAPLISQSFDFGIFAGKSSYQGEMQDEYYNPSESKAAYGGFVRTKFNSVFALRMQYLQTTLSGNDANAVEPELYHRNLNFSTNLNELSLLGELTIINFGRNRKKIRARSYLFGGIGGIYFNPMAVRDGKKIALQPLGTEGQMLGHGEKPYQRYNIVYPFGWGFEFYLNRKISLGFEIKARKTQTDYLDDVAGQYPDIEQLKEYNPMAAELSFRTPEIVENYSHNPVGEQRGDNKKYDSYLLFGFTASVKFFEKRKTKPDPLPIYFDDPINR